MKKVFLLLGFVIMCVTSAYAENTPIVLKIGGKVLRASLNDSRPSKSLIAQLPVTVRLYDSDNDFCGGNLNIDYSENDIQKGYKNGDLAFWTPANNL